jgi:hypothetical protein
VRVSPVLLSQDGRWWWDGHAWRTRAVEGSGFSGLDLFWFTSTPQWFERIAVTGLIGLIPFVGTINLYGWTLVATDMIRRRWKELPPAGFQYLDRGLSPFVVGFVYGLAFLFVLMALVIALLTSAFTRRGEVVVGTLIVLAVIAVVLVIAWWLVSLYFFAALLMASDKLGIARAMDPRTLFHVARSNSQLSLRAALIYGASTLVLAAVSSVIPFGGVAIVVVLPAVLAMIVPRLAEFEVEG